MHLQIQWWKDGFDSRGFNIKVPEDSVASCIKYQIYLKKAGKEQQLCSVNTYVVLLIVLRIHQHIPMHTHTHIHSCVVFTILWDCTTRSKWNRKTHICSSFAVQSERAKHVMGSLDLSETVELIDSRIHQRWHSQQRHTADSSDLASFTWIWFDQNFKMS